jgi:uncharacterized membrane protein
MTSFALIKLIHILSATLLFGTGLGSAFFMLRAWRCNDAGVLRETAASVVLADWIFTTPAVIVQLLTGLWLVEHMAIPFTSAWFIAVLALYAFVGLCWLPVVVIQVRIRDLARAGVATASFAPLMHWWMALGAAAFSAVLVIFWLMVFKPGFQA